MNKTINLIFIYLILTHFLAAKWDLRIDNFNCRIGEAENPPIKLESRIISLTPERSSMLIQIYSIIHLKNTQGIILIPCARKMSKPKDFAQCEKRLKLVGIKGSLKRNRMRWPRGRPLALQVSRGERTFDPG